MITDEQAKFVIDIFREECIYTNELAAMCKALEAYEASKWVSIEYQKPLPRQIVMNSNNVMAYWEDGKWKGVDGFVISPNAQYWQPLPEFKEP